MIKIICPKCNAGDLWLATPRCSFCGSKGYVTSKKLKIVLFEVKMLNQDALILLKELEKNKILKRV